MKHVYLLALGEFGLDDYELGGGATYGWFMVYFVLASFILLIHLLNMLIAIMGETFSNNNEIKHKTTIQSHLRFVLNNWWRDPIKDKTKVVYLITAFLREDDVDEDGAAIQDLTSQV